MPLADTEKGEGIDWYCHRQRYIQRVCVCVCEFYSYLIHFQKLMKCTIHPSEGEGWDQTAYAPRVHLAIFYPIYEIEISRHGNKGCRV